MGDYPFTYSGGGCSKEYIIHNDVIYIKNAKVPENHGIAKHFDINMRSSKMIYEIYVVFAEELFNDIFQDLDFIGLHPNTKLEWSMNFV